MSEVSGRNDITVIKLCLCEKKETDKGYEYLEERIMSEKQWLNLDKVLDWIFPLFLIEVFVFGNICLIIFVLQELGVI